MYLLVNIDSLIGLGMCCVLDFVLDVEWCCVNCYYVLMFVLMIDVDDFKFYNDKYGYVVGDIVLCMVVCCINDSIKCLGDFVGCYGGEEFCVVLFNIDFSGVLCVVESICIVVLCVVEFNVGSVYGMLMVSIGVVFYFGVVVVDDIV